MSAQITHVDPEETIRKLKAKVARLEKALAAQPAVPLTDRDLAVRPRHIRACRERKHTMTPEIILNVVLVLVLVSMGGIVALGLWALDGMMDDESPIERAEARYVARITPKPPAQDPEQ